MSETVLVTGATGNIGHDVVPALIAGGAKVRAFVRDRAKAAPLEKAGAELAVGELEKLDTVASALKGVDTLLLITPPGPTATEQCEGVIGAAEKAGIKRIVRISVVQPDARLASDNVRQHSLTDARIQKSGIAYTILRPNFFMQNLFMSAQSIAAEGKMYWGMGDGRLAMVDVRDIVDVAAKVTLEKGHENKIYSLTGPAAITFGEAAQTLSKASGREITYVAVPPSAVEESLKAMGMGDWFPGVMRDYSKAYSENWGAGVSGDTQKVLGKPARSFESFATEVLAPALKR